METFFLALLTAFIWGFVPFLEKIGLSSVEPTAAYLVRCSGVVIGAVMVICFYSPFPSIERWGSNPSFPRPCRRFGGVCGTVGFLQGAQDGEISRIIPSQAVTLVHISSGLVISWRGGYPV